VRCGRVHVDMVGPTTSVMVMIAGKRGPRAWWREGSEYRCRDHTSPRLGQVKVGGRPATTVTKDRGIMQYIISARVNEHKTEAAQPMKVFNTVRSMKSSAQDRP